MLDIFLSEKLEKPKLYKARYRDNRTTPFAFDIRRVCFSEFRFPFSPFASARRANFVGIEEFGKKCGKAFRCRAVSNECQFATHVFLDASAFCGPKCRVPVTVSFVFVLLGKQIECIFDQRQRRRHRKAKRKRKCRRKRLN